MALKSGLPDLKETRDILREIENRLDKISKGYEKANKFQKDGLNDYKSQLEAVIKSKKLTAQQRGETASLIKELTQGETTLADIADKRSKVQSDLNDAIDKGHTKKQQTAQVGVDILNSAEQNLKVQMAQDATLETIDDLLGGNLSKASGMLDVFKKMAMTTRAIAGGGVLLMAGMFKYMYGLLQDFSAIVDSVGQQFGVMGAQNLAAPIISATDEAIQLGKSVDDLIGITSELSTNFGISVVEAANLSAKILDSSVAMGLSSTESAKLFGTLMKIGGLTADQAENLAESTYQLAQANNINPAAVMNELASNTESFALFSKDGGKNIALAAVNAVKLGVSFSNIASMAEGLLDFQSSLNKEIEVGILLGRNINLQKARELALENDLVGATAEVLKQVGSEAEFNQMNFFQRKAIADLLNSDVATMAKLVKGNKDLVTETKSFSDLIGADAISDLTGILNKFKSIGAIMMQKIAPPLKDLANSFNGWLESGGWERIEKAVTGVANVLKFFAANPKLTTAIFGALAGFSLGGFKGAAIGGLGGLASGAMMGLANGGSFVTNGPTPIMTGDNPGGRELVTAVPLNTGGSGIKLDTTPIAREISTLKGELTQLRSEMKHYLGLGGISARETGQHTTRNLQSVGL